MVALDGNINLIFLLYISFELRCLLVFSVAWEGELVADMSTAISDFVSRPHVFDHKRVSLPFFTVVYTPYVYALEFHLPSRCITRSETSPPAASVEALPILSEWRAYSLGLRPDFSSTSLNALSS